MSIDQYLGTTKHKNIYFPGTGIPPAWVFKSHHTDLYRAKNSIIRPLGIDYTINNLGYNSRFDYDDSLTHAPSILCLGDSNVFGLHLEKDRTFADLLQQQMPDIRVLNLGLPGGGADSVTRIGVNTVMFLKNIQAVFVVWPTYLRREFASIRHHGLIYRTGDDSPEPIPYPEYWDFIDWRANSYNFHKNRIMLSAVCESHKIMFVDLEINYEQEHIHADTIETYGKNENTTFGFRTHRAIADYFANKISTNY
jgi:hypothetical protein